MWELVLAQQNRPPQDCRSCLFWLTTQLQKKIQGTKVKQGVVHQSRYNGFNFEIITLLFYCLGKCGKAPDCREGLSEKEKLQFTFYSQQVLGVTSISLRSNIRNCTSEKKLFERRRRRRGSLDISNGQQENGPCNVQDDTKLHFVRENISCGQGETSEIY